jgi:phosphohistidine phosphatase SixA
MTEKFLIVVSLGIIACGCDDPYRRDKLEETMLLRPGQKIHLPAWAELDWEAEAGSIDANGWYEAPLVAGAYPLLGRGPMGEYTRLALVSAHIETLRELRKGRHVLYFRHGDADQGRDNPDAGGRWWESCDSTKARQLSTLGREQARAAGLALRRLEAPVREVASSAYCRCRQTAEALAPPGVEVHVHRGLTAIVGTNQERLQTIRKLGSRMAAPGVAALIVGHNFPDEFDFPRLNMGDAAVFKKTSADSLSLVALIPADEWLALGKTVNNR